MFIFRRMRLGMGYMDVFKVALRASALLSMVNLALVYFGRMQLSTFIVSSILLVFIVRVLWFNKENDYSSVLFSVVSASSVYLSLFTLTLSYFIQNTEYIQTPFIVNIMFMLLYFMAKRVNSIHYYYVKPLISK